MRRPGQPRLSPPLPASGGTPDSNRRRSPTLTVPEPVGGEIRQPEAVVIPQLAGIAPGEDLEIDFAGALEDLDPGLEEASDGGSSGRRSPLAPASGRRAERRMRFARRRSRTFVLPSIGWLVLSCGRESAQLTTRQRGGSWDPPCSYARRCSREEAGKRGSRSSAQRLRPFSGHLVSQRVDGVRETPNRAGWSLPRWTGHTEERVVSLDE